jgi:hypothetical protein
MKPALLLLAAVGVGCGGGGIDGDFLRPSRVSMNLGQGRSFEVSVSSSVVDLVVTETPPEGVHFETETGLGTSRVQMWVECEASATPGTYRIDVFTYGYSKSSGYVRTGEDELTVTIKPPP